MHASQIKAKIISNVKGVKAYRLLTLEVPYIFRESQPGQFIHIKTNDLSEPLLRRPFSIHALTAIKKKSSSQKYKLDVLYEIKGKGTALLAKKDAGEYLDIIGPLGRGFDCRFPHNKPQTHIIIAGGMGVAPLVFLADKLAESNVIALIGATTKSRILCEQEFKDLGCRVQIATEDGCRGFKGRVLDLFEKKVLAKLKKPLKERSSIPALRVYACGPELMLTRLAKICIINKIPLQVSLEEFMGCGIGACLCCAIKTKQGYLRGCKDGPVFQAEDIAWKF